jgi:hypothetical protein
MAEKDITEESVAIVDDVVKVDSDEIDSYVVEVSTIEDRIDEYFDEKRELIAEKIGVAIDSIDDGVGDAVMVYLMSGNMLRSGLALMCYNASGGDSDDANDIAAIIEALSSAEYARDEITNHDYASDINNSIKNTVGAPESISKGDFGFIGDAISTIVGSPKAVFDGITVAKAAVNDTIAEIWRGDYTIDSSYVTQIKAGSGIAMSSACRVGSEKAGYEECIELCHLYGRNFAVAHAVAEDICKMVSCVKSNSLEFDMGLSLAYALDKCGANSIIGEIDNKEMFKELKRNDNIEDAKLRMLIVYNKYSRAAISAAKLLPDSIYKDMLIAMPTYIFAGLKEEYDITDVL